MPNNRLISNLQIDRTDVDYTKWPVVLPDNFSAKNYEIFQQRKNAVELYLQNEISVKEICLITRIKKYELERLVKRCFNIDEKGFIWGYKALIPRKKLKKYIRKNMNSSSKTGMFEKLLNDYPIIKEKIIKVFFNLNKDISNESIINYKYLHKKFIDECYAAGISSNEYPFNTEQLARIALFRYAKKLQAENFYYSAKRFGEDVARYARSTGKGEQNPLIIKRPFERVQFDGHKIDVIISITFYTPDGDEITVVIDRIWLLIIMDVATRMVIGHYLSLNKEYTMGDVLICVRNAILPKVLKQLSIPGLKYQGKGGFHSLEIPETIWGVWEEFSYDNGKANLSNLVRNRLETVVGCAVNPGPVNMPERRSIIERFFGILEENGYHRIPSTTGSNPEDPRRKEPEKKAVKYKINIEELEELTEVLISNYNHTQNSGVNYLTPIECMRQRIERGMVPRTMRIDKRNEISLLTLNDQRVIKGDISKGKRPYINYEGVVYRNDILAQNPGLIGVKLDLIINIDDIRSIKAFMPDGSEFGILCATGKWGVVPHNLQTRKQINKLRNKKLISFTIQDDPIDVYYTYLKNKAMANKADRNKLAAMQRKLNKSESSLSFEEKDHLDKDTGSQNIQYVNVTKENSDNTLSLSRKIVRTIIF